MPYPNEHAARLLDPDMAHIRVRRTSGSGEGTVKGVKIPNSIDVIWYIVRGPDGPHPMAQALRFPVSSWTAEAAHAWVKENKISPISFEAAEPTAKNDSYTIAEYEQDDSRRKEMRFDIGNMGMPEITPEGYLKAQPIVTRIGVFTYYNNDGSIRKELRHPTDVFNLDSLNSMKMIPVTNDHPAERMVNAESAKRLAIGNTGESIVPEGNFIRASMVILDAKGVESVKAGKKELSLGYTVDLVPEHGNFDGETYTFRQTNIRYNHLAIVRAARAGSQARLNIDEADIEPLNLNDGGNNMPLSKIALDGIQYEASQEVINSLEKSKTDGAAHKTNLDIASKELETTKAERDSLKEKLDKAEKAKGNKEEIQKQVRARIDLEKVAAKVLDAADMEKISEKSDDEIRKSCILKKSPELKLDDKSPEYVQARFDMVAEEAKNRDDSAIVDQKKKVANDGKGDKVNLDQAEARKRMIDRQTNAYKNEPEKK